MPSPHKLCSQDEWNTIGTVLMSPHRTLVLRELSKGEATPKGLSGVTGIAPSHVSSALRTLMSKDLVTCLSPDLRRGRLYSITEKGRRILESVNKIRA